MPDEGVSGALNQRTQGKRARVKQMVLTIDPKHAHTLPLNNSSILDHYGKNSSLCVFVCRGPLEQLTLHLHCTLELKYSV